MIFSLYIINKAGGLIYQKDFNEGLAKLSSNEYLVLAGTFHRYLERVLISKFILNIIIHHSFNSLKLICIIAKAFMRSLQKFLLLKIPRLRV